MSSAEDVWRLRMLERGNLAGPIVGKALYEGRGTRAELLEAAGEGRRGGRTMGRAATGAGG